MTSFVASENLADPTAHDIDRPAAGGSRGHFQSNPRGNFNSTEGGTYGMRMAPHLHLESAPFVTVNKLRNSTLAVTRLRSGAPLTDRTTPIPPEPALTVSLHLRAASAAELWYGGRPEPVERCRPEG